MAFEDVGLAIINPVVGWINTLFSMLLPGNEYILVLLLSVILAFWLKRKTGVRWWVFLLLSCLLYITFRYFGVGTIS